jgi:hypothetical protein
MFISTVEEHYHILYGELSRISLAQSSTCREIPNMTFENLWSTLTT